MTPVRVVQENPRKMLPTLISAQAQLISSQTEPERRRTIMVKHTRFDHVRPSVQLFRGIGAHHLFPIVIRRKMNRRPLISLRRAALHERSDALSLAGWSNKLAPECCVEVSEPMRVRSAAVGNTIHSARLSRGRKLIAGSCQANHTSRRHCDTGKHGYPNSSMLWLENEHCV